MIDESLLEKTIKKLNFKFLQSDRKYRWMLSSECGSWSIKRNIKIASTGKRTFQRLPRKLYGHLPKEELEKLITRLNYNEEREIRVRDKFKVESAFISQSLLKEFYDLLESEGLVSNFAIIASEPSKKTLLAYRDNNKIHSSFDSILKFLRG